LEEEVEAEEVEAKEVVAAVVVVLCNDSGVTG
jgi:hypothetical protein